MGAKDGRSARDFSAAIYAVSPTLLIVAAALLWSAGGIGVKSADGNAMAIAGWRAVFAAPVLALAFFTESTLAGKGGVAARYQPKNPARAIALAKRPLAWVAAISYATMVVAYVVSTKLTTAANSILIQYSGPVYVALLSGPLLGERVRASDWASVALSIAGMVLFFFDRVSASGLAGNLVAILSSFGFAGVPLAMRLELKKHPQSKEVESLAPYVAMILGNILAALVCLPMMIAHPLGARSVTIVLFLGVFQIGCAYWLYGRAVGKMPAVRSSLIACVEPILNPMWVLVLYGEKPARWALAGGAIILASVALQATARSKVHSRA